MVLPVNTSGITGVKSLRDFKVDNALDNQKIQAGNLANANASNLYATQVLTGAIASGDQAIYDNAKSHLGQMGIDMSNLAPDISTAATQVDKARQAQYSSNPLLALMGLGLRAEGNQQQAASTMGSQGAGAAAVPLSTALAETVAGRIAPGGAAPVSIPAPAAPAAPAGDVLPVPAVNPGLSLPGASGGLAAPQNDLAPALPQGMNEGSALPVIPEQSGLGRANMVNGAIDENGSTATKFVPPKQQPGQTLQAYQDDINNHLAAWKESAPVKNAQKKAEASGSAAGQDAGEAVENSVAAKELFGRIEKNLDAMIGANPNVPIDRWGVTAEQRAWLSQNFGNQDAANAYNSFAKVNKAQVLNGIQELAASGTIRSNQQLVKLVDTVNAIEDGATKESRAQQIEAVRAELKNLQISAENVNARLNGGQVQGYQDIPHEVNQTDFKRGMLRAGTDGTYVLIGNDPTQQSSWQKVKQ